MAINLLNIQPNKVSRDLSGYMTYLYAPGGAGKTTFGSQMPSPLILAAEKGYSAIPGVMAQDIDSWTTMRQVIRELKKPEVKATFKTLVIDTVDVLSQLCEKYICNQLGIENIGDGGWTVNGWAKVKREWEETFRTLSMEGYAILFISHCKDKTFTRKNGTTYNQIVPSCSNTYNEIIRNMVDIETYIDIDEMTKERRLILRSDDESVECKCRFKYIDSVIPFGYSSLVSALNRAIDREAEETNGQFVTNEKNAPVEQKTYDYDALMVEFKDVTTKLMNENQSNGVKITAIIDKVLGKGKRINETTPAQAELVYLVIDEIKATLM